MDWYLKVLKNYVGFRGRARRKEYWMFILVNIIFTFVLGLLDKMLGWQRAGGEGILTTIYGILVFLRKRLVRTVLIFTESSDQLSRATDRVPGLPASPGYVQ